MPQSRGFPSRSRSINLASPLFTNSFITVIYTFRNHSLKTPISLLQTTDRIPSAVTEAYIASESTVAIGVLCASVTNTLSESL